MRVEQGYAVITDRLTGKVTAKYNVFSCCHCGQKVHTPTLHSHEYGTCANCDDGKGRGLRCNRPACQTCIPHMRKIEDAEMRARFRANMV